MIGAKKVGSGRCWRPDVRIAGFDLRRSFERAETREVDLCAATVV